MKKLLKLRFLLSFLFISLLNIGISQCVATKMSSAPYIVGNGPDLARAPCTDFNAGGGSDQATFNTCDWGDATYLNCGSVVPTPDTWYSQDAGATWSYFDCCGGWSATFQLPSSGSCSGGGSTPSFSAHPSSGNDVCLNGTVTTMSITASNATSYQWYVNASNSNSGGLTISGATNTSYTPPSTQAGTKFYYCVATGSGGFTPSNTAKQTIDDPPTDPTSISGTTTICNGSSTTLTAGGGTEGTSSTYTWGTGSFVGDVPTIISGQNSSSIAVTPGSTTTYWVTRTGNTACTNTTGGTTQAVTVHSVPFAQSSSFTSSSVSSTTATVGWTRGSGDNVLVVARQGGAVDTDPTNGSTYTADAAFGSGNEIGTGNYVVYVGTGTSVDLTSLSNSTTYHLAIYEYETGNSCNLYNLTQLTGNFTTTGASNNDPVISAPNSGSAYTANYEENGTGNVADVNATDSDGDALTYSLSGDDAADFSINSSTGVITFASTPNFENPQDANTNNEYIFTVTVSDGNGGSDTQNYTITVTNASSESATSNGNGNWNTSGTWGDGVPGSGDNVTINNDINVDANVSCNNLTVNASDELTVNSSRTLTVSGTTDVNGVITVNGTLDINGTFDATGATVNLGSSGKLILNGSVTSLGTLDALEGTVEYDGGTQNVIADAYYNLEIDQSGTKTAQGSITVAGTMTVQSAATYALAATSTTVTGASDINGVLTASTGTYDANGSFDATGATIDFSDAATLKLAGTITSLGALDETDGTIELDGSSSQDLPTDTYNSLKINNAAGVVLEGNTTINGTLTMTLGDLTSSSSKLLTIKSSMSGASASSHVVGPVKYASGSTSSCVVGIGTGTLYHPVTLAAVSASAENYTVEYKTGTPFNSGTLDWDTYPNVGVPINSSNVQYVSNDYYYDITRSGSVNAYITISFSGVGIASPPAEADQYLMHYNSSTNRWDEMTTTHPTSTTVRALATSFSPFGPGSGGGALPIDLVSFTGKCENHTTELEFVVGSQINNDYYTIERSVDGNEWSDVGIIQGEGNTSTQMTYKWIDDNPMSGVNYYRLTQTDYDGNSEIFAPVALTCEMTPIDDYSVYPNPADGLLNIDIELENYQGEGVSIEVTDINGRAVKNQIVQLKRGFNHLELDLNDIPGGIYMINFVGSRDYIKESRITKK